MADWIDDGDSGGSVRAKLNSIPNDGTNFKNPGIEITDGTHDVTGATKMTFTGVVVSDLGGGNAGVDISGGGSSYTTGAVSLDGSTYLTNAAVTTADSSFLSAAIWFFIPDDRTETLDLFDFDPANTECPELSITHGGSRDGQDTLNFIGSNSSSVKWLGFNQLLGNLYGGWHSILLSVDTSPATTYRKRIVLAFDDVPMFYSTVQDGAGGAFTMLMSGLSLGIPDTPADDTPLTGYMSDFWLAAGQFIDFGVTANRRKFVDANGRPVSLGADGSVPTGTAPTVFLRAVPGNEVATWPTNLGTGGAFTVTGTLAVAPSSPTP